MKHYTPDTFKHRTVNCDECGGSGMRMGCAREIECFDCSGEGSWDGACAECHEPKPLNNDGLCDECSGLVTVEYLKRGVML